MPAPASNAPRSARSRRPSTRSTSSTPSSAIAEKVAAAVGSRWNRALFAAVDEGVLARAPHETSPFDGLFITYLFYEDDDPAVFRRGKACLSFHTGRAPGDPALWARLAHVWLETSRYGIDPPPDWADRARAAADAAMKADPEAAHDPMAQFARRRMPADLMARLEEGLVRAGFVVPAAPTEEAAAAPVRR